MLEVNMRTSSRRVLTMKPGAGIGGRQPQLLLKFDEYVGTWIAMIRHFYEIGISDDVIFGVAGSDERAQNRLAMLLGTQICSLAMRVWSGGMTSAKAKECVRAEVVAGSCQAMFGLEGDSLKGAIEYYENTDMLFGEALERFGLGKSKSKKPTVETVVVDDALQRQMLAAARFVISKSTGGKERDFPRAMEQLGLLLLDAGVAFEKLTSHSIADGNTMLFKEPRFIVTK